MPHLPARSLWTALLATALSAAVAVPAAAAPSAPTNTPTSTTKRVKKAGDDDFVRYRVRAGRRGQAEARGRLRFDDGRLRHVGDLFLDGRGRALVFFRFVGEDRWDRIRGRAFRTRDERETDFRVHRFVKKVVITVCHVHRYRTFCNTREFFGDDDDGYRGPDRKGSKAGPTAVARGHKVTRGTGRAATVVKRDAKTGKRPAR